MTKGIRKLPWSPYIFSPFSLKTWAQDLCKPEDFYLHFGKNPCKPILSYTKSGFVIDFVKVSIIKPTDIVKGLFAFHSQRC